MTLNEILQVKGSAVHSITPDASLVEVARRLVDHHCGSLLVCQRGDCDRVFGIITERDLLQAAAANDGSLQNLRVDQYMTSMLITANPQSTIEDVMGLMTENRIRHVPVLEGDRLVGMVSIGDIVKAQRHLIEQENHLLKSYILS